MARSSNCGRSMPKKTTAKGELEPEELAALEAAVERSMEQARLGQVVDADEVLRKLAARG